MLVLAINVILPFHIKELTGVERYNAQMKNDFFTKLVTVNKNGDQIYQFSSTSGKVEVLSLLDEDGLQKLRDDREPLDSPSLPSYYTPQPERPGKLVWITGPPGAGKSTCAQLMGRHHGYFYFEGDAFFSFVNPYIDVHVENPSLAIASQKNLKGIPVEVIKIMDDVTEAFQDIWKGNFTAMDVVFGAALPPLTDFVKQQRERLGGNMSLAWAILSRKQREKARELLGEDVVFIVLNLTRECQKKRVDKRHQGSGLNDEMMNVMGKMHELYEPAGDDEKNAFNVTVTENMSPSDVMREVEKILETF